MEIKKINGSLAMIIITMIFCSSMIFITLFVSTNPLEISFKSDDNVVEISQNLEDLVNSSANAQINLQVCETKLEYYENMGLDNPWRVE